MIKSIVSICIFSLLLVSCNKDEGSSIDITSNLQGTYTGVLTVDDQDTPAVEVIVTRISNTRISVTSNTSPVTAFEVDLFLSAGIIISSVASNGDVILAINTTVNPFSLGYSYNNINEEYVGTKN